MIRTLLPLALSLPLVLARSALAAPTLDRLEADLAAGNLRDVAAGAERLARSARDSATQAAAWRMAAVAHDLLIQPVPANSCLAEAVIADSDFPGNVALLNLYEANLQLRGLQPEAADQLKRLDEAARTRPELEREVRYARAIVCELNGDVAGSDSLRATLSPLLDFWLAAPYDNMAGSGVGRREDPERGLADTAAVWSDQFGRSCTWRRVRGNPAHGVDLDMLSGNMANSCHLLLTHVRSDSARDARLHLSGSGRFRAWLNGARVLEMSGEQTGGDPLYVLPVHLRVGWNRILVKACCESGRLFADLLLTDASGAALRLPVDPAPEVWDGAALPEAGGKEDLAAWDPGAWLPRWMANPERRLCDDYALGSFLQQRGFRRDGAAVRAAVEAHWPGSTVAELLKAGDLVSQGRGTEASELRRQVAGRHPELLELLIREPSHLMGENDVGACRRLVKELAERFPHQPDVVSLTGIMMAIDGSVAEGMAEMRRAVALEPGNPSLREALINMLKVAEDEDARRSEIRAYAAARPDLESALRWQAGEAFRHDQAEEALAWARKAWQVSGRDDVWHREAALILQRAGRFEQALIHAEEAVAIAPKEVETLELQASLLEKLSRSAEALAVRQAQCRANPLSALLQRRARNRAGEASPFDALPAIDREALLREPLDWLPANSSAVYIFDSGEMLVNAGGSCEYRHHFLVRLLTAAGVEAYQTQAAGGEIEIARTIKADGRQIAADVKEDRVAFADLEPGDMVEMRVLSDLAPVAGLPGEDWDDWYFDVYSPALLSRYAIIHPLDKPYRTALHNIELTPRRGRSGDRDWMVFEARRRPGILREPDSPEERDFCAWLDLSTVADWTTIQSWYSRLIAGRLEPVDELKELAAALSREAVDDSIRTRRAVHLVKERIHYEGGSFANSGHIPRPVREVLRTGYGDCKDQAVLLVGLLRELDIEATVALVNSTSEITRPYLPSQRFTHAIVRAQARDGRVWWIDPTAQYLDFPNVPVALEGQEALVVDGPHAGFERIAPDPVARRGTRGDVRVVLDAEGGMRGEGRLSLWGEEAGFWRNFLAVETPESHEQGVKRMVCEDLPAARLDSFRIQAVSLDENAEITWTFTAPNAATRAAGLLLVPPPWSANDVPDDFTTLESRRTALDITEWRGRYEDAVDFALPAGADLLAEIKAVDLSCPAGRYHLWSEPAAPGHLRLCRLLEVHRTLVPPEEYPAFRDMMRAAWKAEKENIVLKLP